MRLRPRHRLRLSAAAAAAGVGLALSACNGGADPAPFLSPAPPTSPTLSTTAVPSPAAPVPSVPVARAGYAEPCQRVAKLAGEWAELSLRAAESADLSDVARPEVESLINRLTAVTPELPADVQPLMPGLVDPMVQLRGVLMTGVDSEIVFGPGKTAVPEIFQRCAVHIPAYDDGTTTE